MISDLLKRCSSKLAKIEQNLKTIQEALELLQNIDHHPEAHGFNQSDLMLLEKLITQIDRLYAEASSLKLLMEAKCPRSRDSISTEGVYKRDLMDSYAQKLIGVLKDRPGPYTISSLSDLLGMNEKRILRAIKRAIEIDPEHIKLTIINTTFYVSFVPGMNRVVSFRGHPKPENEKVYS